MLGPTTHAYCGLLSDGPCYCPLGLTTYACYMLAVSLCLSPWIFNPFALTVDQARRTHTHAPALIMRLGRFRGPVITIARMPPGGGISML